MIRPLALLVASFLLVSYSQAICIHGDVHKDLGTIKLLDVTSASKDRTIKLDLNFFKYNCAAYLEFDILNDSSTIEKISQVNLPHVSTEKVSNNCADGVAIGKTCHISIEWYPEEAYHRYFEKKCRGNFQDHLLFRSQESNLDLELSALLYNEWYCNWFP